jgi:hypothetical protein
MISSCHLALSQIKNPSILRFTPAAARVKLSRGVVDAMSKRRLAKREFSHAAANARPVLSAGVSAFRARNLEFSSGWSTIATTSAIGAMTIRVLLSGTREFKSHHDSANDGIAASEKNCSLAAGVVLAARRIPIISTRP